MLNGTGLENSNLKLVTSCTVWSSALATHVDELIEAAYEAVIVAVPWSICPARPAVAVVIAKETGA